MAKKKPAKGGQEDGSGEKPGMASIPEENAPSFDGMPSPEGGEAASGEVPDLDDAPPGGAGEDIDIAAVTGGTGGGKDPLEALTEERDELKDKLLRALAEVENIRRRTETETAQARKYGHSNFARDLLGTVDNLGRAVDALPEDRDGLDEATRNLVVGVEMVTREIAEVMERHGITRIDPMGEKFDHDRHQAMFEVPTADAEPGTVVQVARPGWMLHDRLLSPAMVGVAKKPDGGDAPGDAA